MEVRAGKRPFLEEPYKVHIVGDTCCVLNTTNYEMCLNIALKDIELLDVIVKYLNQAYKEGFETALGVQD